MSIKNQINQKEKQHSRKMELNLSNGKAMHEGDNPSLCCIFANINVLLIVN
jgi:hypothetical protein